MLIINGNNSIRCEKGSGRKKKSLVRKLTKAVEMAKKMLVNNFQELENNIYKVSFITKL